MNDPGSMAIGSRSAEVRREPGVRAWWPTSRDLAAMVGLPELTEPGRDRFDGGRVSTAQHKDGQGQKEPSATVLAAALSQLFK